jgi:hypothetical protein
LQGLDIDAFFAESYKRCCSALRSVPNWASLRFGVGNDRLNDMSDAYIRKRRV